MYCMIIAGWVEKIPYSGKDYFYAKFDSDPFDYSFIASATGKRRLSRKMVVTTALRKAEALPKHVREVAAAARLEVRK